MIEFIHNIKELGAFSLDSFWFPLLIWTACSMVAFLFLRMKNNLNPLFHYHLRTAALLSLPLGIFVSFLLKLIPTLLAKPELETAFFIINNPIEIVTVGNTTAMEQEFLWQNPSFLIGMVSLLIITISAFMLLRFFASFIELRKLHKNLNLSVLNVNDTELKGQNIRLAYHDHPLVPFTFGWKNPVIVLPEIIRKDSEKMQMALQHELTHIKRGDFLLQLALSIIESIFWFHPLIHFGTKEIDTFREISCDQEVLSKSDFSVKSYANLLYELVPLNTGVGRLSVSMAVHNSTLKQRIKTMKYHKLYKTSFKQSIFFLLLMVIGITLPIACSDLRGPQGMSIEELEATTIELNNISISINGKIVREKDRTKVSTHGLGAFLINANDYGVFAISPVKFDNANRAGDIKQNVIEFSINQMNVEIVSEKDIIATGEETNVWVRHFPEMGYDFIDAAIVNPSTIEDQMSALKQNGISSQENSDNFFVVVEEMPEPIGGMAAIQSKVQYPGMARRAGIEGRVTVQFIVNENGDVENAKIVRGIGGGCDEEALRVVEQAKFKPGIQRGKPVRVQFALSLNFRLSDADFGTNPPPPSTKNQ